MHFLQIVSLDVNSKTIRKMSNYEHFLKISFIDEKFLHYLLNLIQGESRPTLFKIYYKTIILSNANTISAKKKKIHFSVIAPPSANNQRKPKTIGCLQEIIVSDFFSETNPKYSFQHQGEITKKPREMY